MITLIVIYKWIAAKATPPNALSKGRGRKEEEDKPPAQDSSQGQGDAMTKAGTVWQWPGLDVGAPGLTQAPVTPSTRELDPAGSCTHPTSLLPMGWGLPWKGPTSWNLSSRAGPPKRMMVGWASFSQVQSVPVQDLCVPDHAVILFMISAAMQTPQPLCLLCCWVPRMPLTWACFLNGEIGGK